MLIRVKDVRMAVDEDVDTELALDDGESLFVTLERKVRKGINFGKAKASKLLDDTQ